MTDITARGDHAAAEYTAAAEDRAAALREAITTTITGQPLPEALRPPAPPPAKRPKTSSEWLLDVLKGPSR